MGNKTGQPLREESRTQLQTAETYSATTISKDQQQQQQPLQQHPAYQTKSNQSKTGSGASTSSTASGNSSNSKQAGKKKNKLRKGQLPQPKQSQTAVGGAGAGSTTPVIQQTTQSVTGSDPNQLNNNIQQDVIKKDVTTEEQEIKKPSKKSKDGKKHKQHRTKTRTTTEETVIGEEKNATIEKDATVESPAPGSNGPLARRKKYKLSGPKPKDDNTEFERIKTKARPARQKKNSLVSGTKNLARMMETAKTKEELSLKSFDEDDELVTARLEPTQPISEKAVDNNKTSDNKTSDNKTSDNKTSDNKTSDDTATPEKSTKAKTLEKSAEVTTTTTAEKSVKVTTKTTTTTTPARSAELTTDKDKGDNFKHSDYL